uniref:Uncharacterized protein n=1 Tax=Arundo donax TaxID=35708 RepID=A0A0A8XXQ6_ARUDO
MLLILVSRYWGQSRLSTSRQ